MKVDIIEDCKFSLDGISPIYCKAGESGIEIKEDIASSLIESGFAKVEQKAIKEAPENKMLKVKPEVKAVKKPKSKKKVKK